MIKPNIQNSLKYSAMAGLMLVAIFIAMVQHFAHSVRTGEATPPVFDKALLSKTGIVIATGSEGRVDAGLALMLTQPFGRLLISGTGDGVSKSDLQRVASGNEGFDDQQLMQLFDCCVDLDHAASNTLGNAFQSQQWADQHQLSQVVLVTSDFHMPRALVMFQEAMPGRVILPYRVTTPWLVPDRFGALSWWRSLRRVQIISREMVKYYAHMI